MARKDISDWLVCKAVQTYQDETNTRLYSDTPYTPARWPYGYLAEWTGEPEKVCYAAMERAYNRGLIECGVSLRSGWLSEMGKTLLCSKVSANEIPLGLRP